MAKVGQNGNRDGVRPREAIRGYLQTKDVRAHIVECERNILTAA